MKPINKIIMLAMIIGQSIFCISLMASEAKAKITIQSSLISDKENLQIEVYNLGISDVRTNTRVKPYIDRSVFVFEIAELKQPTYFRFTGIDKRLSQCMFLLCPDDNINIEKEADKINFSGNNAMVYECIYKQSEMSENFIRSHPEPASSGDGLFHYLKYHYILNNKKEIAIKSYEGKIEKNVLEVLLANLRYAELSNDYSLLALKSVDKNRSDDYLSNVLQPDTAYANKLLISYPWYVISKFKYEQARLNQKTDFKTAFKFAEENFKGRGRQQIIAYLLANQLRSNTIDSQQFENILSYADADFALQFREYTKGKISGALAPDFELEGVDGKLYTLDDFKGKVIVMDFWFTGCGACKLLNPILEQATGKIKSDQVVFLSISIDKKKEVWKKSLLGNEYSFPGTVKLYTSGLGNSHSIISDYNVNGYPTIIIISPKGKLLALNVNPRTDNAENLLSIINKNVNHL